jgi:hypothetical protein
MLSGLGEGECVRPALKQLHADQTLQRNHMARQRALRDQQRVGGGREAAVLGDAFEGTQCVQRQPASVDALFLHRGCVLVARGLRQLRLYLPPSSPRPKRRAKRPCRSNAFFRCG